MNILLLGDVDLVWLLYDFVRLSVVTRWSVFGIKGIIITEVSMFVAHELLVTVAEVRFVELLQEPLSNRDFTGLLELGEILEVFHKL